MLAEYKTRKKTEQITKTLKKTRVQNRVLAPSIREFNSFVLDQTPAPARTSRNGTRLIRKCEQNDRRINVRYRLSVEWRATSRIPRTFSTHMLNGPNIFRIKISLPAPKILRLHLSYSRLPSSKWKMRGTFFRGTRERYRP